MICRIHCGNKGIPSGISYDLPHLLRLYILHEKDGKLKMCFIFTLLPYEDILFDISCFLSKRQEYFKELWEAPMFRLWGKIWKDNHLIRDTVFCDDSDDTRTHKVFRGLEQICYDLDLGNPIWLDTTIDQFKRHDRARFYQDNFIEHIDFDFLEIHVIEED